MKFKDLNIGDEFDWIGGKYTSFFLSCIKTSFKTYQDTRRITHTVGSPDAEVYHVKEMPIVIAFFIEHRIPVYCNNIVTPCYDCGSIFPRRHTPDCNMAWPGDDLDLPQMKGCQWWGTEE